MDSNKLDIIMEKLSKLDLLDTINDKLKTIESELTIVRTRVTDLEQAGEFLSETINTKASKLEVDQLTTQVDDLSNRLRRNNLIFFEVPEEAEGRAGAEKNQCESFLKNFFTEHLQLDGEILIERAHRIPTRQPKGSVRDKPRPMHVAFLRHPHRQQVLYAANKPKGPPLPQREDQHSRRPHAQATSRKEETLDKTQRTTTTQSR
jgi:uncharacterized protein YoxC